MKVKLNTKSTAKRLRSKKSIQHNSAAFYGAISFSTRSLANLSEMDKVVCCTGALFISYLNLFIK